MVWGRLRSWYGNEVKSDKALLAYRYTSLTHNPASGIKVVL